MKIFAVKGRNVFSDYPYNPEIIEYYLSEDSAKSHVEKLNSETKNFDDEFGKIGRAHV